MERKFNTVALVGRFSDKRVTQPMEAIANHLKEKNINEIAAPEDAPYLSAKPIDVADFSTAADLIIAVGGDGTMLYAARHLTNMEIPVLGINRGRLGFLADVSPIQMLEKIDEILIGNYIIESRLLLEAKLTRSSGQDKVQLALNDVVFQRQDTGRLLDFETSLGGEYVNTHMGDGLIVATPTGSTAYALSCGGPILEPQIDAVVLAPICPHTLSDRPIVIPSSQQIEVKLLHHEGIKASISVDGQPMGNLTGNNRLTIYPAKKRLKLIHPEGYDYYEILRSKLNWGRDNRKSR